MRHPDRANDCPWWKEFASRIAKNGFSPVPVLPHQKKPRFNKWQNACYARPDPDFIRRHGLKHGRDSIGIACGRIRSGEEGMGWLFAVDCDADDPTVSRELECITVEQFGETPLLRVGQQPRWLRLYRSPTPVGSAKAPRRLELLGAGRQVVALGYHPRTGGPYEWPPDSSPVEIAAAALPLVEEAQRTAFLETLGWQNERPALASCRRQPLALSRPGQADVPQNGAGNLRWTRDARGWVIDGRDAFLTWCIAKANGDPALGFDLFKRHADLDRPKRDSREPWSLDDAQKKARSLEAKKRRSSLKGGTIRGRPALGRFSDRPWSADQIAAFNRHVEQFYLNGQITRTEMQVSHAMASLLAERGQCFASVETIAAKAGVSPSAVKKARPALDRLRLWRSKGTTGKTAAYVPLFNPPQVLAEIEETTQGVQDRTPYTTSVGLSLMGEVHLSNDNSWHPKTGREPSQLDLFLGEALKDPISFGRQVRQERQRMGLSQRVFGERIGCRQAHVANVERGHDRFSEWSRRRLVELARSGT